MIKIFNPQNSQRAPVVDGDFFLVFWSGWNTRASPTEKHQWFLQNTMIMMMTMMTRLALINTCRDLVTKQEEKGREKKTHRDHCPRRVHFWSSIVPTRKPPRQLSKGRLQQLLYISSWTPPPFGFRLGWDGWCRRTFDGSPQLGWMKGLEAVPLHSDDPSLCTRHASWKSKSKFKNQNKVNLALHCRTEQAKYARPHFFTSLRSIR